MVVMSCSLPARPRFIFRRFISRKLVEMGPNSPPPQPGRFVSCCGHVPSVRLLDPLHDKPWSFANTVRLQLCATVCAMALPAGVRRQTAAWYFDVFWANKILFYPLRKRNVNRNIEKTTSSRNFWICREYAFCFAYLKAFETLLSNYVEKPVFSK